MLGNEQPLVEPLGVVGARSCRDDTKVISYDIDNLSIEPHAQGVMLCPLCRDGVCAALQGVTPARTSAAVCIPLE
jgi:hypothetical protein